MGMLGGLTMMASGPLVAALGAAAYYAMAAMCVAGAALAWWLSGSTRTPRHPAV